MPKGCNSVRVMNSLGYKNYFLFSKRYRGLSWISQSLAKNRVKKVSGFVTILNCLEQKILE